MAHLSSVVLCSNKSITAHQRQINNSKMSNDIVLSEITMSVLFTDLKFTVCRNKPPCWTQFLRCSCCNNWDMLYITVVEAGRSKMWSNCLLYVDGQRVDGGKCYEQIYIWGRDGQRAGIMVSISRACRAENKWGQKEKGKMELRMWGGREK